jgi:hypothetical protein
VKSNLLSQNCHQCQKERTHHHQREKILKVSMAMETMEIMAMATMEIMRVMKNITTVKNMGIIMERAHQARKVAAVLESGKNTMVI